MKDLRELEIAFGKNPDFHFYTKPLAEGENSVEWASENVPANHYVIDDGVHLYVATTEAVDVQGLTEIPRDPVDDVAETAAVDEAPEDSGE
jgi:hypothetical protein